MSQEGVPDTLLTGTKFLLFLVDLLSEGLLASTVCDHANLAYNGLDLTDSVSTDGYVRICIAAVNALRYSYFGVGTVYIIMTIASFAVS
ncbi:hypothetical protein BJ742DRAFT_771810 [Cladochytrium replicatum]|nr:hypothetical protein BJ742DRAFT_771810 [Cladochytrium replicatum]